MLGLQTRLNCQKRLLASAYDFIESCVPTVSGNPFNGSFFEYLVEINTRFGVP